MDTLNLTENDDKIRQIAIQNAINHFNYEFVDDGDGNLKCQFCKVIIQDFSLDFLNSHVADNVHQYKRMSYVLEQQRKKGYLKVSSEFFNAKLELLAEDALKLEADSNMRVEKMSTQEFQTFIANKLIVKKDQLINGKLEKVKYALNNKLFSDSFFKMVKCNKCHIEINDSITEMINHLEMCDTNFKTLFPTIDWKVENSIVEKVSSEKYLSFSSTKGKIRCCACKDEITSKHDIISKHLNSLNHEKNCKIYENSIFINNTINSKDFINWLCLVFSSTNISFNTIKSLQDFFVNFMGREIPCEGTLRNHLFDTFNFVVQRVREEIGDNFIYISMDEASTNKNSKFVSCIVGTLIPENPHLQKHFVFRFEKLNTAWTSDEVMRIFENILRQLYGDNFVEIAKDKLKLFVCDAGSQMVSGGKMMKIKYPSMVFLICFCHNLHNLCETIIEKFPNAKKFITAMNNILYNSPAKMDVFLESLTIKKRPVKHCPTRWGTGLDACDYWFLNFDFAVTFLNTLNSKKESSFVLQAKNLIQLDDTRNELEIISTNYSFISKIIHKLEQRNQSMETSIELIEKVKEGLNKQNNNNVGIEIINRLNQILNKNPGYNELVNNIKSNPKYAELKYAPPGSYDAERANKIYKSTMTYDRSRMHSETTNMKAYIRFNSISLGMRDVKVKNIQDKNRLQPQCSTAQKLSFSSLFVKSEKSLKETLALNSENFSFEDLDRELDLELDYFDDFNSDTDI